MKFTQARFSVAVLFVLLVTDGRAADVAEPLLGDLPPGIFVDRSTKASAAQTEAIGNKLGGRIERLTNSHLRVHGRPIQVNVIVGEDEENAKAVHAALSKIKSYPFCLLNGKTVVEYVGRDLDVALATKTCYELGLSEKPTKVNYRVIADLATVEQADYMACNLLFNQFLSSKGGADQQAVQQIREISTRFRFGSDLALRHPKLDLGATTHLLEPKASTADESGAALVYSFDKLPKRQGIPFVTVTISNTVDRTGFHQWAAAPEKHLTAATTFWPSNDPAIVTLAKKITAGKSTNETKAMAILRWLAPGRNIKYSGRTGSRWGTATVLKQRFGHCWDFSDCFVTLARAAGVPSRQVAGWFYGSSGHVWAEFFREGKGWQQVDPTGGGQLLCGIYHIPYFTSEDGEMPIVYVAMPKIEMVQTK